MYSYSNNNGDYCFVEIMFSLMALLYRKEDIKVFLIFQLTLSNSHSKIYIEIWLAEATAAAVGSFPLIKNLCYFRSSGYRRFLVSWRFWWNMRPKLHLWEMNEYSRDNHHSTPCLCGFTFKGNIIFKLKILERGDAFSFWCILHLAFSKH